MKGRGAPDWVSRAYGEGHHGWANRAVSGLPLRCLLSVLTTWAYRSAYLLMAPRKISAIYWDRQPPPPLHTEVRLIVQPKLSGTVPVVPRTMT